MRQLLPFALQFSSALAPHLTAKVATELFLRPRRHPASSKESSILDSAHIETLQSGRKVYLWSQNPQAPLVAFVHGWESRGTAIFRWIPLLLSEGFQVMTWDGPAHGESPGKKTSAPEMAKAFAQDLNELNWPLYAVMGHSLGGVVLGLLSQHMALPQKVIVISSPARISGVLNRYHDQIRLANSARKSFQRQLETETGISMTDGSLIHNDLSLNSHALVIHDLEDREVPFADFQELQTGWKKARFLATQGLGHRRILRDESVGHQIAEFLKEN